MEKAKKAQERLSEDQVRVQIAKCPACKGIVKMSVAHMMTEDLEKDFLELMKMRCEISQIGLEEARNSKMCFLDCDKPLVVERNVIIEKIGNTKFPYGTCKEKNCTRPATIDYNEHEHWVCQEHYDSLSRYFDEEYK